MVLLEIGQLSISTPLPTKKNSFFSLCFSTVHFLIVPLNHHTVFPPFPLPPSPLFEMPQMPSKAARQPTNLWPPQADSRPAWMRSSDHNGVQGRANGGATISRLATGSLMSTMPEAATGRKVANLPSQNLDVALGLGQQKKANHPLPTKAHRPQGFDVTRQSHLHAPQQGCAGVVQKASHRVHYSDTATKLW